MSFSSVEVLNQAIKDAEVQIPLTSFETRFLHHQDDASKSLKRLLVIKEIHRNHPAISKGYDERRKLQEDNTNDLAFITDLTKQYSGTLEQISLGQGGALGNDRVHCFLDLGYFPGGFSSWLLENNPGAQGVGIDEKVLSELTSDTPLRTNAHRYTTVASDIITLVLQAVEDGNDPIIPLGAKDGDTAVSNQYDLVIGCAFPGPRSPKPRGDIPWSTRPKLVLAQLLIILTNTKEGGRAILHINTKPFAWIAEVIGVLWACFADVGATGVSTHKKSTSCYLICSGFRGPNDDTQTYKEQIRSMLYRLKSHPQEDGATDDPEQMMQTLSGRSLNNVFCRGA
ncbi:hypothetical protein QCA50_004865 [Cerrena zonata]|uniref:Ribosomal RNA methyltransferase FtsJ domain-containing protein n=1 Tax=Cerrena zonata TaxID=2478898 RepID=A0AAW0GFC8_9APHY